MMIHAAWHAYATMKPPRHRLKTYENHAGALMGEVLDRLGSAAGLVDRSGNWLCMSPLFAKAVSPSFHRLLVKEALRLFRTGESSLIPIPLPTASSPETQPPLLVHLTPLDRPSGTVCLLTLQGGTGPGQSTALDADVIRLLRKQALTDPLTGLYNRRWVSEEAKVLLNAARQTSRSLSLMLLDLDHFKQLNDAHGHLAGDRILEIVSARLSRMVRPGDCICRFGGEEFLILLPATPVDAALQIAERMRHTIAQPVFELPDRVVTASAGISEVLEHEQGLENALQRADKALYAAKAAGRNCVRIEKGALTET